MDSTLKNSKQLDNLSVIYQRPESFIGSKETVREYKYIFTENQVISKEEIWYNEGLEKIILEILYNAVDNVWRSEKERVKMTEIRVTYEDGWFSISNNGYCISTRKRAFEVINHRNPDNNKTEEMYPAEFYFGNTNSGSNFNDNDEERKTSGRYGTGSKVTTVFSCEFLIEIWNALEGQYYKQLISNNSRIVGKPTIQAYKGKSSMVKISFLPDYEFFCFDKFVDLQRLVIKHVHDAAMISKMNVYYGNDKLKIETLLDYSKLFFPNLTKKSMMYAFFDMDLEAVIIEKSQIEKGKYKGNIESISFVNGLLTPEGGTHVDFCVQKIFQPIVVKYNSKAKENMKLSTKDFYPYFFIFVRFICNKPEFENLLKKKLTSKINKKVDIENYETIFNRIWKSESFALIKQKLNDSSEKKLEKVAKKVIITDVSKFKDAFYAGKKNSKQKRVLWFTEGQSAKSGAESGACKSLKGGFDYNGFYAMTGVILNVQNASTKKFLENTEFKYIYKIAGLQRGYDYFRDPENPTIQATALKNLRYDEFNIMTDQDDDGFHIQFLLLSFFFLHHPGLIQEKRIKVFNTAVVHAKIGTEIKMFYSFDDFKIYQQQNSKQIKQFKYFKGLGTHTAQEMSLYFLDPKIVTYVFDNYEETKLAIIQNLDKKQADSRKEAIIRYLGNKVKTKESNYSGILTLINFIETKLWIFFETALSRAIPCVIDGFKESQIKTFYGATMISDLKSEAIGVIRLGGEIMKFSHYHHGDKSLHDTITKMSQSFIGSNNLPLFIGDSNFGDRTQGGKNSASPRYQQLKISPLVSKIFIKEDYELLEHRFENKDKLEPYFYVPILPMILINGAEGIACGFSTYIPNYNPIDIIDFMIAILEGNEPIALKPWYRYFKGEIEVTEKDNGYVLTTKGSCYIDEKGLFHITELPIGCWTNDFQSLLEELKIDKKIKKGKSEIVISALVEEVRDVKIDLLNEVNFIVKCIPGKEDEFSEFLNNKLVVSKSINNMVCLDPNGLPKRYNGPEDIIHEFMHVRYAFYEKRKENLIRKLTQEILKFSGQYKFLNEIISKDLKIHVPKKKLIDYFSENRYILINDSYDYLLSIPVFHMTEEKMEELKTKVLSMKQTLKIYKSKEPEDFWKDDLASFLDEYKKFYGMD